jgi:sulfur-carrier protein
VTVQVALFASLREVAGVSVLEVPADGDDTVGKVLEALFERCPELREKVMDEKGELQDAVSVLLAGRNVCLLQGLNTPVGSAERVAVFPAVAGG